MRPMTVLFWNNSSDVVIGRAGVRNVDSNAGNGGTYDNNSNIGK